MGLLDGWSIEEGNHERWITQIHPDSTSIGLFRVRCVIDSSSSIYERFARSFENASGKNTMYFQFHPDVFSLAAADSLAFKITWLDKNAGSTWALQYFDSIGLQTALSVTGFGDNQWKTVSVTLHDAVVNQGGPMGADFMLVNTDGMDDIFHGIEVDITRTAVSSSVDAGMNVASHPFPNATTSIVRWDPIANAVGVIVYNSLGAIVLKANATANRTLDLSTMPNGLYFIQLRKGEQIIATRKVIKE